ncbi:MAG: hypothetical protein QNJ37_08355 [Crocosphaera sp.]|nr:hypothetical protein [Crocosphaera sp.]
MRKTLEVQELAIVIIAQNYDPSLLNPSLLIGSGIIEKDWKLLREPIVNNNGSQLLFENGITLVGQPGRLTLVEAIGRKASTETELENLSRRYVDLLPEIDYQSVGLNFRGYIKFEEPEEARKQFFKTLLAPGDWQSMGTAPVQAGLNLAYTFEEKQLNLSINEAKLNLRESEEIPVMLFTGNFNYELKSNSAKERQQQLKKIIEDWQTDLDIYTKVVKKFIKDASEINSSTSVEMVIEQAVTTG